MEKKSGSKKGLWLGLGVVGVAVAAVMLLHGNCESAKSASGRRLTLVLVMMVSRLVISIKMVSQPEWILR